MITKELLVNSDTIKIPELQNYLGKKVEILILEKTSLIEKKEKLKRFFELAGKIDLDDDAILSLREKSKI